MNDVPFLSASLSQNGKLIIGMTAECGCCHFSREVSYDELHEFLQSINFQVESAKHVLDNQSAWCAAEGSA